LIVILNGSFVFNAGQYAKMKNNSLYTNVWVKVNDWVKANDWLRTPY